MGSCSSPSLVHDSGSLGSLEGLNDGWNRARATLLAFSGHSWLTTPAAAGCLCTVGWQEGWWW